VCPGRPAIGKSLVIGGATVVLVAYTLLVLWLGHRAGVAVEAKRRRGVSPRWAREVTVFLRRLLAPAAPDASAEDFIVLPEAVRKQTTKLLGEAPGEAEARAERRAAGW
jgi:hypothetical protein